MRRVSPMAAAVVLAALLPVTSHAATRAYFVEPKLPTSAWCPYGGNVAQSFRANVDSIHYIEWFCGELSAPGFYVFDVKDEATGQTVAHGQDTVPTRGWQWVRCDNFSYGTRKFTKGKDYILKVSHSAGDSVNFVYRTDDPYAYGHMSVSGGELVPEPDDDLVARVYGRMNAVDPTDSGAGSVLVVSLV
jgi:hypothetical protein